MCLIALTFCDRWIPLQMASNAEGVLMPWRHNGTKCITHILYLGAHHSVRLMEFVLTTLFF